MKKLLTLIGLITCASLANAQCDNIPIPVTAVVIDASGTSTHLAAQLWICSGVTATITGGLNTIYIESNSTVTANGNYNTAWVKAGSNYTSNGDSCIAAYDPGATAVGNGSLNTVFPCGGAMSFNYANAPTVGCAGIGFAEQAAPAVSVQLVPNPADDQLTVRVSGATVRSLVAMDQSGREVLRAMGGTDVTLDVSDLETGNYLLRVETDRGATIEKFTKR